jgi:acyl-[acyl carrier protein]--UDP-N-acetylglucosamine O-acyltransferase
MNELASVFTPAGAMNSIGGHSSGFRPASSTVAKRNFFSRYRSVSGCFRTMKLHFIPALISILSLSCLAERPELTVRSWFMEDGRDVEATLVSADASKNGGPIVSLKSPDGKSVSGKLSSRDGHSLRYVANVRTSEGREFRDWHFDKLPKELSDFPTTVRGAFLRVVCEDHEFSTACVELMLADYSRRYFPLKAMNNDDRALAEKLQAEVDAKSAGSVAVDYPVKYEAYTPERDAAVCNFRETPHFLFHWGNDQAGSGKDWWKDGRQQLTFDWFERVWRHFEAAGAPMPMAAGTPNEAKRAKIPVYISGTGLPKHKDGFAFGGQSILMHPGALGPGSSVVGHEFTHTMQLHMGGFRSSPLVGWFWECHANWSSHQFMPDYPGAFEVWLARAHYELNSSRHNYGSWLFMQQLAEDPRFGPGFCYEVWLKNRKDEKDASIEDPIQTFQRIGVERGVWKNGVEEFGDAIGEMAARRVTMDFSPRWAYTKSLRFMEKSDEAARLRTTLEKVPDRAGWWRPLWSAAPRQYGINLVELVPDGKSADVEVELSPVLHDRNHEVPLLGYEPPGYQHPTGFRATLVAVNDKGEPRYSRMTTGRKLTLPLRGEKRVVLAIAATPSFYWPDDFRPGYGKKPRFPYELSVRGATPSEHSGRRDFAKGDGAPHANGGGWVGKGAKVAATAFVGPDAMVLDGAKVNDNALIVGRAVIRNGAQISGNALIDDWAVVGDTAKVSGDAIVRGNARLSGSVSIEGRARVMDYVHIDGKGTIRDDALVRGWGEIHTDPEAPLGGGVIAGEDLECHLKGRVEPINGGMLYGYLNAEIFAKELEDNRGLYARWSFDKANGALLTDANADCTATLRGAPAFVKDGDRRVLTFNGRDQYAIIEPHAADSAALTFDMMVNPAGATANQVLFHFQGPFTSLLFTPRDAKGRAVFLSGNGNISQIAAAPALVPRKWTRVTLSIGGGTGRIFLDGKLAATAPMTLPPQPFTSGWLARSSAGGVFAGALDDFSIYRRAITDVTEISEPWKTPADWQIRGGAWTLENGVFRQSNATAKQAVLFLPGSETWTDYTIALQARRLTGPNAFRVHFRSRNAEKGWVVDFGQDGKGTAVKENGVTFGGPNTFIVPNWDEWQDIKITVRGGDFTAELAGKKVTEVTKPITPASGGIALGTRESSAEFRNIKVTDAAGKVLFVSQSGK